MDKELNNLISNYKSSLEKLTDKISTINSSQQHDHSSNVNEEHLSEKLKLKDEVQSSQLAVQLYIDNMIWNLFSRTELQHNTLLFNNDQNRVNDKKHLMRLILTLFEIDKKDEGKNTNEFLAQLHEWMLNVMNIYLRICTLSEKKKILQLLISTRHISSWAIPLIQYNIKDIARIDDYIEILDMVFFNYRPPDQKWIWTEEDFLSVLDQLAIDFHYSKLLETVEVDEDPKVVFRFTQRLATSLMGAIRRFSAMNNFNKRLSQTLIQISTLLIDSVTEKGWHCQDEIDMFIAQIVYDLYNLRKSGWFFLPNIPFKHVSINKLWEITIHLLQIKWIEKPTTMNDVLDGHLPNITRFQYDLHDNQIQAVFMLTCLTNIAICIPSRIDQISSVNNSSSSDTVISACIVSIIAYTLFDVAFVDKELREIFYKDVRDHLSLICQHHSFVVSLLFRWTVEQIDVMGRMALYLFHSINLDNWILLHDDLKLLHKLFSNHIFMIRIQFGKYIIEHLNYDYKSCTIDSNISKSQPWRSRKTPVLPYDIHEEIAFILLDACQQFQPLLPDNRMKSNESKNSIELMSTAVSTYLPLSDQIQLLKSVSTNYPQSNNHQLAFHFIHWAWSIAIRLKLYDSPVSSRASELEDLITLPFLKLVLHHHPSASALHSALLVYISFILSTTSRHFLRFEANHGWIKLLIILKRGKAEAILQIFSDMIPSFVYMHGDDFFNDSSLVDFLKHMIELKSDPMLNRALEHVMKLKGSQRGPSSGVGYVIGSHIWHAQVIDSASHLLEEDGKGFSYVDLMLHSWFKTIFHRDDWIWQHHYVSLVDLLCKFAFLLGRHHLIHHMLTEEQKEMEAIKVQNTSPRLTRLLKNIIPEVPFKTLLVGEWSLLKANTFNKQPGVEDELYWFAYEVLVMETVIEAPLRDELSQILVNQFSRSLATDQLRQREHQRGLKASIDILQIHKQIPSSSQKPLDFFVIYRWLQHMLIMPMDHPLLPLYCQMFFSLYYQPIIDDQVSMGYLFFSKRPELIMKLRDYIANVQTYYGKKIAHDSGLSHILQQFYYSIWLWLGNEDMIHFDINMTALPSQYNVHRLKLCYAKRESEQPWHHIQTCWTELVDVKKLEHDFLVFPWEGSEKFIDDDDHSGSNPILIADDSLSMVTTLRHRSRLITNESTIMPLPPIIINEPNVSTFIKRRSNTTIIE
ncbi:uncharacterized protein BX663DRAFT_557755 [Cokeromyces recurvatus]|uniref:uncharacterized protein n=1 Tax=Cokeromyces recurvatus TaxID=90255 RepID=UPI00222061ED|nr:uncharacterized protein BX663DRAFT_557755 [Cokeromyces recurvatus]KAI7907162.1 hypothetical protein BX663DRAFT_557755 [Cokeromyces recurvatus]